MRLMVQDEPQDFIVATGEPHTVEDGCETAFGHLELDWRRYVTVDTQFERPPEVAPRIGNALALAPCSRGLPSISRSLGHTSRRGRTGYFASLNHA